jgi:hypothetical protein
MVFGIGRNIYYSIGQLIIHLPSLSPAPEQSDPFPRNTTTRGWRFMMETGESPCPAETFAAYQKMLLAMNSSNVDEVVTKFNEDSTWADPYFIAQIVTTVAGGRKNGPELIEFMTKIIDSRGYSALLRQIEEIERGIMDASIENAIAEAITRGFQKSPADSTKGLDLLLCEVSVVVESEAFPVRAVLSGLWPLVEAIAGPLAVRDLAGHDGPAAYHGHAALSGEGTKRHASFRKVVEEAAGFELRAEAVVAAAALVVRDFPDGAVHRSMASALRVLLEPLRVCLETVKRKVDVARGFSAVGAICAGAGLGSALELFGLRWSISRCSGRPPEVNPFAAALVAQDLARLRELIGGRDVKEIRIDVKQFPLDIPRRPCGEARLLQVAATVGGQVLRYLPQFHRLKLDHASWSGLLL